MGCGVSSKKSKRNSSLSSPSLRFNFISIKKRIELETDKLKNELKRKKEQLAREVFKDIRVDSIEKLFAQEILILNGKIRIYQEIQSDCDYLYENTALLLGFQNDEGRLMQISDKLHLILFLNSKIPHEEIELLKERISSSAINKSFLQKCLNFNDIKPEIDNVFENKCDDKEIIDFLTQFYKENNMASLA